ncbi:hypothetical protein CMI45_02290 [Candidatus Pacearchaeota archaeon]|jgi:hypothetical protein|nr:hypothetical protein [Candidatus Pacearchaeota archaeon]|tara:strand:- start:871 stop:1104 length:234 start_codon:yes stop_codon:yes gene_type:complete
MGIDIGAQREVFFKDLATRITFDDPSVDVIFRKKDYHRCESCVGEIDGDDAYEVVVKHGKGASLLYFHVPCYNSLFE